MDFRVSRRNFLQNAMALVASPVLPRLPIAEVATAVEAAETAAPVITAMTPLQKFVTRQVQGFVSELGRIDRHAKILECGIDPFVYGDPEKTACNQGYIKSLPKILLGMNIRNVEPLLYILKCHDWKSNIHMEELSIFKEYNAYKRTFVNEDSIRSAIHAQVNAALAAMNPDGVPEKDSIGKNNLQITYAEQARYFSIAPKKEGAYSRSDVHFLMESEFMKIWGFRPRFFDLSAEHVDMLDTLERHPLMRHGLMQRHDESHYFWQVFDKKDEEFNPFNSEFKPWTSVSEEEKKVLQKFREAFESLWPKRTGGKNGWIFDAYNDKKNNIKRFYNLRINYADIEATLADPEEFMRRAKKHGASEARNVKRRERAHAFQDATFESYPRQYSPDEGGEQESPACLDGYLGMWKVHYHHIGDRDMTSALRERFSSAVTFAKIGHDLYAMPNFNATDKDLALLDSKPYEPLPYERKGFEDRWGERYKSYGNPPETPNFPFPFSNLW